MRVVESSGFIGRKMKCRQINRLNTIFSKLQRLCVKYFGCNNAVSTIVTSLAVNCDTCNLQHIAALSVTHCTKHMKV